MEAIYRLSMCDIKKFISLYHAINYTIYSFDYYLKICIIFWRKLEILAINDDTKKLITRRREE